MTDSSEATHQQTVRDYRRELAVASTPLQRAKLLTLIARMNMAAKEHGWSQTDN